MNKFKSILITGGAGFIGSHVVRRMVTNYPDTQIVNLDALTYASNLALLNDCKDHSNYNFVHEDINNFDRLNHSSNNMILMLLSIWQQNLMWIIPLKILLHLLRPIFKER